MTSLYHDAWPRFPPGRSNATPRDMAGALALLAELGATGGVIATLDAQ
jgi:hypothetical protein